MMMPAEKLDSYRLHLKAFVDREQKDAYKRSNYLSKEWQDSLRQNELERAFKVGSPDSVMDRRSPQSVAPVTSSQSEISVAWRELICQWKFDVVDKFDIERDIVCISTYYLDQYLSTRYVDEELFQLTAISCIYLAIKLHSQKKVGIECIAMMGRGMVLPDHIEAMELSIMLSLEWNLFPPTPLDFIQNSFPLITRNVEAFEFSQFLTELSVCAYPFLSMKPSTIAVAASLIAIDRFGLGNEAFQAYQDILAGLGLSINSPDVLQCCSMLRHLHMLATSSDASS